MTGSAPPPVWLESYPPGMPARIDAELARIGTVASLFHEAVTLHPDRVAVRFMGHAVRYGEIGRDAAAFARFLRAQGIGAGERVALMLPNCPQVLVGMFGTLLAGCAVVNVGPSLTPWELRHLLADSGAVAVLAAEAALPVLAEARIATAVRVVVTTGLGDMSGGVRGRLAILGTRGGRGAGGTAFADVLARHRAGAPVEDAVEPGTLAFLQYTGGTTGVAKGAMLTHANIVANVVQAKTWMGDRLGDGPVVNLTLLPLHHVFSLTANALVFFALGGESLLVADPRDVKRVLAQVGRRQFDVLCGTATLFANLLESAAFRARDFAGLKLVVSGGMTMPRALAERWASIVPVPITQGYGLTEASPVLTVNPITSGTPAFTGSVGLPVPGTEVGIRRPDGGWAAPGEEGEIVARGPQVMAGYWNRPVETAATIDAEGWLATGDLGTMDARGFVRIVDRLDDMIIVGGFNVHPAEVEEAVAMLDGVVESAAFGVPDGRAGERVGLRVVVAEAGLLSADAVRAHCRNRLSGYKVPGEVELGTERLPRNAVGKVLRRMLRDRHATGGTDVPA